METPPSGMPSPPLSPHGTPSSLASDFPSLSGSLYSFVGGTAPDSPCSDEYDAHRRAPLGFSSQEHPEFLSHLILPSLALHNHGHDRGYAPVSALGDHQHQLGPSPLARREQVIDIDGNVRLLVFGKHGAGKTLLCETLVQGLVEVHGWSYQDGVGRVLSASTATANVDRGTHATAASAPNVRITRADGWDDTDESQSVVDSVLHAIRAPFHDLDRVFHPSASTLNLSMDLLSSSAAPLYTAAILVLPTSTPTPTEALLLRALSQHLPTLLFSLHRPRRHHSPDYHSRSQSLQRPSRPHSRHYHSPLHSRAPSISTIEDEEGSPEQTIHAPTPPQTSAPPFTSHRALREWLFDLQNIQKLRREAAEKFFRWRERERKVDAYTAIPQPLLATSPTYPMMPPYPADAFERFTFDQLFAPEDFDTSTDADADIEDGFGGTMPETETDEESNLGLAQEEDAMAKGYIEHQEDRDRAEAWETDLSRMVALRKRQTITRMDTIRRRPPISPTAAAVRQPLASVLPADIDAGYSSEGNAPSTRNAFSQPSRDHDSEESALPPSTPPGNTKNADHMASSYDPLHLPSLFSLLLSILPDLGLRFWPLIPPFPLFSSRPLRLPTHANDLGVVGSEKTVLREKGEGGAPDDRGSGGNVTLPMVGVLCAAAAGVGFCAGVAVGGGRGAGVGLMSAM